MYRVNERVPACEERARIGPLFPVASIDSCGSHFPNLSAFPFFLFDIYFTYIAWSSIEYPLYLKNFLAEVICLFGWSKHPVRGCAFFPSVHRCSHS